MKKTISVLGIILLFMVFFGVGYYFNGLKDSTGYFVYSGPGGDYDFFVSDKGDYWLNWTAKTKVSGNLYALQSYLTPFAYGPAELVDIYSEKVVRTIKNADTVYLTRDVYLDKKNWDEYPKGGMIIALLNLDRTIQKFGVGTEFAAIEKNERSEELNLPVIGCENANSERVVIFLKEGLENKIYKDGDYCVVVEFKENDDPNKVATKLAYELIGVM